jgi:hypothetical protein
MKDEKMANKLAEEYVKHWIVGEDDNALMQEAYKDGFLAGLKAGRPEWHDLRKDPNDLPKEDMYEAVIITPSGEWEKGIFRRTDCKCYWRIVGFNENVKVIAWCEIPTLDKE